jgi:flagellar hook-associated protein 1 FlgK
MSSDLMSIARSSANAARVALDVTAQNIANAGTDGYVRRTVAMAEVSGSGMLYTQNDVSLHGVRVAGIVRNADEFRLAEVRRTGSDLARANAEVGALSNIESAIEQPGVSSAIATFSASLQGLKADPTNPALRAVVMENARSVADALNAAAGGLDSAKTAIQADAVDGVSRLNQLSSDLAKINTRLVRASDGTSDQAALLDKRDSILKSMSEIAGVTVTIGAHRTADVSLGGVSLVTLDTASTVGVGVATDGSLAFDVGGTGVSIASGSLAGTASGLNQINDARSRLDDVAATIIGAINGAQASGVALDGSAGQPLFGGTGAGDIVLIATNGSALATAPAGAGANSRNAGNLDTMIAALGSSNALGKFDALLTDVSSAVAGRTVTRDALGVIASGAEGALATQAGVSLDDEAANLLRYQQAFQASGRIMQVSKDLFDSILSIN